jgi:hypothetical protein
LAEVSKRTSSKIISGIVEVLEDVSDDLLDSDIYSATRLRRLASNIALAFVDNDLLIASLDVDEQTKTKIAAMIKEAVESRSKGSKTGNSSRKLKQ